MFNNNILVNAAINGFVKGALSGRPVGQGVTPTPTEFAALYAAAVSYATSFDLLFGAVSTPDPTISGAGGVTLPPMTAAITANQNAKVLAAESLSAAMFDGRYVGDVAGDTTGETQTPGFYASQAATVYAQYLEAVATFTTAGTLA